jgi:hypothetical protein
MNRFAFWFLLPLALLIAVLALTADPVEASGQELPAVTTQQADVSEKRLVLHDGRTLLCLTFVGPTPVVNCDWGGARNAP